MTRFPISEILVEVHRDRTVTAHGKHRVVGSLDSLAALDSTADRTTRSLDSLNVHLGGNMPTQLLTRRSRRSSSAAVSLIRLEVFGTPVTWDRKGQHTVSWHAPLRNRFGGITTVVAAGSCNIYNYPLVDGVQPSAAQAKVVAALILAISSRTARTTSRNSNESGDASRVMELPDSSGATPMLALLVSNSA